VGGVRRYWAWDESGKGNQGGNPSYATSFRLVNESIKEQYTMISKMECFILRPLSLVYAGAGMDVPALTTQSAEFKAHHNI
jgi:hypothetical protein